MVWFVRVLVVVVVVEVQSNDQRKLCYGCESCKAGVLQGLKQNWKKLAILNITVTIVLVIVYSIGCCALRNNRAGYYKYR
ncbi:Tetraspanin-8 [Acorus gramineus]|uniref:Tetraspanin-8 n=1 Tax=Acorus gramineus TaxID=55184 RepID=A0AAV8ZZZ5_ACOGR|nr:Tetraspanin-8 [Acorus gramineus]